MRVAAAIATTALLVVEGVTGLGLNPSSAASAAGTGVSCVDSATFPQFDQEADGYSSFGDCVVAVPDRTVGGRTHAGAVEVDQTGAGHVVLTRASIGAGAAQAGDRFGASIGVTNVDGDGFHDLLIGAPGVANAAGRVYVVYGSANGLGHGRATRVLGASVRAGSEYGASLAVGLNYSPEDYVHWRVLVGAPGTKLGSQAGAGAVYRYSVRYPLVPPVSVTFTVDSTLTEAVHAALRPAKANERFGATVATDACGDYVGAPGEVVGTNTGAGAVVYAGRGRFVRWTQNTAHVAGTAEKGDAFGSALSLRGVPSRIAVGAPGEDVGKKRDAGSVTVVSPKACPTSANSLTSRAYVQGTVAHTGTPESGDRFGASVRWIAWSDYLSLFAGAPGEDIGTVKDAGAVVRLGFNRASCSGTLTTCGRVLTQSAGEYTGTVGTSHRFGTTIGAVPLDEAGAGIVVGAPGDAGGRGALSTPRGSSDIDLSWFHARPGDHLGTVSPIG